MAFGGKHPVVITSMSSSGFICEPKEAKTNQRIKPIAHEHWAQKSIPVFLQHALTMTFKADCNILNHIDDFSRSSLSSYHDEVQNRF